MNNFIFYLTILLTIPLSSLSALSFWGGNCCWNLIGGAEGGVAITSDAGRSKTFNGDPSGEFYKYHRDHDTQSRGMYGGFLGVKWQGFHCWDYQIDINYNQSSPFSVEGRLTQGVDVQSQNSYDYKYKIKVKQLLVEGKLTYTNYCRFRPYVLAGIGPSFNKAYSFSTTVPELLTFTRDYKNKTTSAFTYVVGGGLDFEIFKCFYAGISYRFTDFGKASLGSASIDNTSVSGTLSQHNFYANVLFAQLTFVF